MSEEEIIDTLTNPQKYDLIEIIRKFKREGIENFVITKSETLKGLLDLYNKEKEKNKELEKTILEFVNDRERILKTPVISKDKIKDKVEYIRFMVDDDNKSSEIVKEVNLYLDLFLQELLEERN